MATSAKNSDEKSMRAASTELPSPEREETSMEIAPADGSDAIGDDVEGFEDDEVNVWEAEKAGEGYFMPIRVWCASVLFPLCAGCFGPLASAFGICAIVGSWRVQDLTEAPDHMYVGTYVTEPDW